LDDFIKNYKEKLKNQIDFKMLEYKTLKKVYKKLTSSASDKI
ncbi:beta-1,4-N-acetylgalactosaminyltransferase, partial [Campylobacter jejuni]|nr:beta-1,4-N-acetylgalactosaminyltransferase [Campylobacter jejuni]EAI9269058.1 beta-1,4-N-acetylgalactosaminyltransferase [Campylobacter jejuni]EAJ1742097.1 beta-1,4-N-acetylgalactosaminyltransferase [Campylobacter jejuni]EAJ3995102.1 beta-1,4-N-acetylgalactosaminyltransferase [Campylobacter jejuni]EAM0856335.1 beta-1,4-N-acetylgalactosaminyltransferase [Campylobacter jejuni]